MIRETVMGKWPRRLGTADTCGHKQERKHRGATRSSFVKAHSVAFVFKVDRQQSHNIHSDATDARPLLKQRSP
jgi:hypothetical protein